MADFLPHRLFRSAINRKGIEMRMLLTALVLICVSLAGCSTIYRTVSIDSKPATSVNIDAKERMILVTDHGGQNGDRRVICAEPSPDTAVGIAASASAAANVQGKVDAKLASSVAEAVQSVGRRTQTIQLLRDGLYRACEAYMNGAITQEEYRLLLARISAFSVTILAIDGLTGGQGIQQTAIATKSDSKAGTESSGTAEAGPAGGQASAPNTTIPQDNLNAVVTIVEQFYNLQRYVYEMDLKMAEAKRSMPPAQATVAGEAAKKP